VRDVTISVIATRYYTQVLVFLRAFLFSSRLLTTAKFQQLAQTIKNHS